MYFSVFEITLIQKNYTQKTLTINGKNILLFNAKFDLIYSGQENNPKFIFKKTVWSRSGCHSVKKKSAHVQLV